MVRLRKNLGNFPTFCLGGLVNFAIRVDRPPLARFPRSIAESFTDRYRDGKMPLLPLETAGQRMRRDPLGPKPKNPEPGSWREKSIELQQFESA
jgi:hypothetical protein